MQETDNIKIEDVAKDAENTAKKGKGKDMKATEAHEAKSNTAKCAFMYLGPNIPGGRLFSGNLFKCDSPDDITHLEDLFEKLPEVKRLLIEVKQVPDFKRQLLTQGTQASGLYQQAQMQIAAAIKEGVFKHV